MYDTHVHVGTAALIFKHNKLLMLRRGPEASHGANDWSVPGGWIDWGETPEEAVVRETYEEVDLHVGWPTLAGAVSNTYPSPIDTVICLFYRVLITGGTPQFPRLKEPENASEMEWVSIDEVRTRHLFPPVASLLRQKSLSEITRHR